MTPLLAVTTLAVVGLTASAATDVASSGKVADADGATVAASSRETSTNEVTTQEFDSSWPVGAFLVAESRLEEADTRGAREAYRAMISKALEQKLDQVSSINAFAMWRFLQLSVDANASINADQENAESAAFSINAADRLLSVGSPLRGLLSEGISIAGTSLASFEADIWSLLAGYAWLLRDLPRSAIYLSAARSVASEWTFDFEQDTVDSLARGLSSEDSDAMERLAQVYGVDTVEVLQAADPATIAHRKASRLVSERRFAASVPAFLVAMQNEDPNARLQASLAFADVLRRIRTPKKDILALLDSVVADAMANREQFASTAIQSALIARARIHDRAPDRDFAKATADLLAAANLAPAGANGADALLVLARLQEWEGNRGQARHVYSDLRVFRDNRGRNERLESAYYYGAHLEYLSDPGRAVELLEALRDLTSGDRYAPFYTASRFWLARSYHAIGKEDDAAQTFGQLVKERPFDFYGLRARMHLNVGPAASSMLHLDETSERFVRSMYDTAALPDNAITPDADPQLERVVHAIDLGLYQGSLRETSKLFESGETRFRASDASALSEAGLIGALATWRSLRHDVLSSSTLKSNRRLRIGLATKLGDFGDWSTSLLLLAMWDRPLEENGYLAASYPGAFKELVTRATTESNVPPELLYAVMHAESRFSTRAISPTGAMGLLQFQPQTVRSFPPARKIATWRKDLEGSLSDPEYSALLGVRWFDDMLERNGGNPPLAAMEHNAGRPAVRRWFGGGTEGQFGDNHLCRVDLELCIEGARSVETRRFLREVLTTMSIARAARIFGESSTLQRLPWPVQDRD